MKAGSFEKKDFCFNLRFPGQYYDSETGFFDFSHILHFRGWDVSERGWNKGGV